MSINDPLIKILKGHLFSLTSNQPIDDPRIDLQKFCEILELILRKGLRQNVSLLDLTPRDYFNVFEDLYKYSNTNKLKSPPFFHLILETAKSSSKVTTGQGRGRLFLRLALEKKMLHSVMTSLVQLEDLVMKWYDRDSSIIRHSILSEIFLSCLLQLNELSFAINLENQAFLDETWVMPIYRVIKFVPSDRLGLELHHTKGRIIVVGVDEGGIAGDSSDINEGDVLDSLCNIPLRNALKGHIPGLLKRYENQPATLSIFKSRLPDKSLFAPISELLKQARKDGCRLESDIGKPDEKLEIPTHALLNEEEQLPVHNTNDKARYECVYLGCSNLGTNGSVEQVDSIIKGILQSRYTKLERKNVSVMIGEKDVTVTHLDNDKIILNSSFTKISACGRTDDFSVYFCYIEGETSCTIAKQFVGHVFQANTFQEAKIIMLAIAQGFERTHWFV